LGARQPDRRLHVGRSTRDVGKRRRIEAASPRPRHIPQSSMSSRFVRLCVPGRRFVSSGQPPPSEHQAGREPMTAGNIADRHTRLHRLADDGQLLLGREAAATRDARDDFDLRKRVGHRHSTRLTPGSPG
jgi:hypothetical protein